MQSYFGTLEGTNGSLDLLEDSQVVNDGNRSIDLSSSLAHIGLQGGSTGHHVLEQTNITLHSQNELFVDEDDLFVCGRCKQQYTDLQMFLQHKRDGCLGRQQNLQCHSVNLMQQIQQHQHGHPGSIPGAAVLFTQNQDLVSQGTQSHSIMIGTSQCSNERLESTGLNLTQGTMKGHDLTSPAMRNALNVLTCEPSQPSQITINQVGNLVQIQGTQFEDDGSAIIQRNVPSPTQGGNNTDGIVLSEEMLISSVNTQQLNALASGFGNNGGMSSLLQQIPPLQNPNIPENHQLLIHMQQPHNQQNQTLQQKDILSSLNFSGVNLTPFTVTPSNASFVVQDDQAENSLQNLSKLPTLAPRINNSAVKDQNNNSTSEYQREKVAEGGKKEKGTEGNQAEEGDVKKKFTCKHCTKAFTRGFDLEQHVRSHTGEKPFQCIVCGRAFSQKSNVKKHMATHKVWPKQLMDDMPNIVIIRGREKEKDSSEQDDVAVEKDEEDASIEKSNGIAPTYKDALAMMARSIHTCPYCFKMLSSYKEKKRHMNEHKDMQVYKCVKDNCEDTFPDLDSFINHVKSHEGELTYRCHHCHKVFDSLHDLGIHQYQAHLNAKSNVGKHSKVYLCSLCPSKFHHLDVFQNHISTESHNHPCTICQKRFSCERYLRRHLVMMHSKTPKQEVKCEVCGQTMKSEYYLRSHMLIHTKEKPFKCDQCTSAFNRKDKLKRHLLLHDPVKKWKCPLRDVLGCDKEFSRPDKLKAHIIRHGGVKNHKCSYCPKAYSRRCFRIAHERTHTDEFRCPGCRKGFESKQRLSSHKCKPTSDKSDVTPGSTKSKRRRKVSSGLTDRLKKRLNQEEIDKMSGGTAPAEIGLLTRKDGVPIAMAEGPTMYAIRSGNTRKRSARARNAFRKSIAASKRNQNARIQSKIAKTRATENKINIEIQVQEDMMVGEKVLISAEDSDVDVEIHDEDTSADN